MRKGARYHFTFIFIISAVGLYLLGTFIYLCSGLWFTFSVHFLCMREFGFYFFVAFLMYFRLYLWYAFKLLNFLLLLKLMFVSFCFRVHVTWSYKRWDRSFCFSCIYFGICMRCAVVIPSFFLLNAIQRFSFRFAEKFTEICRRRKKKHPGKRRTKYHQRLYNDMPAEWKGARGTVPPRITTNHIYTNTLSKYSTDLIFKWTFIYLYAYIIHPMYASADIKIRNYRNYLNTIQLCFVDFWALFLFYSIYVVICCCCLFALVWSSVVWFIFLCFEYHVSRFRRSWFRSFLLRT